VVLGTYGAKVKATDRAYEIDFVHVFTVRDGRIMSFTELMDTAVVEAAFLKAQTA
jgi:ketosteroid isomerase-like protein